MWGSANLYVYSYRSSLNFRYGNFLPKSTYVRRRPSTTLTAARDRGSGRPPPTRLPGLRKDGLDAPRPGGNPPTKSLSLSRANSCNNARARARAETLRPYHWSEWGSSGYGRAEVPGRGASVLDGGLGGGTDGGTEEAASTIYITPLNVYRQIEETVGRGSPAVTVGPSVSSGGYAPDVVVSEALHSSGVDAGPTEPGPDKFSRLPSRDPNPLRPFTSGGRRDLRRHRNRRLPRLHPGPEWDENGRRETRQVWGRSVRTDGVDGPSNLDQDI